MGGQDAPSCGSVFPANLGALPAAEISVKIVVDGRFSERSTKKARTSLISLFVRRETLNYQVCLETIEVRENGRLQIKDRDPFGKV